MTAAMKKLRAAVFERADGICECGCRQPLRDSGQLDHQFGRAKVEGAIDNCWALTVQCHDDKTNNRPNAAHWLRRFMVHAGKYDYQTSLLRAVLKLSALKAKGLA